MVILFYIDNNRHVFVGQNLFSKNDAVIIKDYIQKKVAEGSKFNVMIVQKYISSVLHLNLTK